MCKSKITEKKNPRLLIFKKSVNWSNKKLVLLQQCYAHDYSSVRIYQSLQQDILLSLMNMAFTYYVYFNRTSTCIV